MRARLLIDNWTLQDVGEILTFGLEGKITHEIALMNRGANFRYSKIPADVVRLECLIQVLNDIIFSQDLVVDGEFQHVWQKFEALTMLHRDQIVVGKPFLDMEEQWGPGRELIADKLCFCPRIRRIHAENTKRYRMKKALSDPFLGQIVWGGAGCLARSAYFGMPYVSHPLRERLFMRASFLAGSPSAHERLGEFITTQRVKVLNRLDSSGYFVSLDLAPAAVTVIQESNSTDDLLKVAVQVRDDFRKVHAWLGDFQEALNNGKPKEINQFVKMLDSVKDHVDSVIAPNVSGQTTLQFGFNWLKLATKAGSPVNSIWNRFGVRAAMNRLIFGQTGERPIRKLLGLFREGNSNAAMVLEQHLMQRSVH